MHNPFTGAKSPAYSGELGLHVRLAGQQGLRYEIGRSLGPLCTDQQKRDLRTEMLRPVSTPACFAVVISGTCGPTMLGF